VIKLIGTLPIGGGCNPAAAGPETVGLLAWNTNLHNNTTDGNYFGTEVAFQNATLSTTEVDKLTTYCGFIQANGSTFGICKSCRFGGLGGAQQ